MTEIFYFSHLRKRPSETEGYQYKPSNIKENPKKKEYSKTMGNYRIHKELPAGKHRGWNRINSNNNKWEFLPVLISDTKP